MPVRSENALPLVHKSICIIGAGAAGLCAARNCARLPNVSITIFEQGAQHGGTWVYEADPDVGSIGSSMYESLVTNLPKEVMAFREFPFESFSSDSFVKREEVLRYLEQYSKPIASCIQYNCRVVNVEPIYEEDLLLSDIDKLNIHSVTHSLSNRVLWKVGVISTDSSQQQLLSSDKTRLDRVVFYYFDCVFVCNGHLSMPKMPSFAKRYSKRAIHSHYYRTPTAFEGMKKVAVIGAGPSGCDISAQLVGHVPEILLLYKNSVPVQPPFGRLRNAGVREAAVVGADADALFLSDGSRVDDLDCVIYCTGYDYNFPFMVHTVDSATDAATVNEIVVDNKADDLEKPTLDASSTMPLTLRKNEPDSPLLRLEAEGRVIRPLYAHVAHVHYPKSLFFIGLPFVTVPFLLFEQQVNFAIALLSGRLNVPDNEIHDFEKKRFHEMKMAGIPRNLFHRLDNRQWEHYEWMWQNYSTALPYVTEKNDALSHKTLAEKLRVPAVIAAIYNHCDAERRRDVEKYHKIRYKIMDETTFEAFYPFDYPFAPLQTAGCSAICRYDAKSAIANEI